MWRDGSADIKVERWFSGSKGGNLVDGYTNGEMVQPIQGRRDSSADIGAKTWFSGEKEGLEGKRGNKLL